MPRPFPFTPRLPLTLNATLTLPKVHIKGGGYPVLLPAASTEIDIQVYIATFWYNVQSFWESKAYCMACLTAFSGLIQPLIQVGWVHNNKMSVYQ